MTQSTQPGARVVRQRAKRIPRNTVRLIVHAPLDVRDWLDARAAEYAATSSSQVVRFLRERMRAERRRPSAAAE